jgi:hypothetical protein
MLHITILTYGERRKNMIDYIMVPDSEIWEYPVDVIELPDGTLRVITNWDLEDTG